MRHTRSQTRLDPRVVDAPCGSSWPVPFTFTFTSTSTLPLFGEPVCSVS